MNQPVVINIDADQIPKVIDHLQKQSSGGIAADRLKSLIDRIERLEEEKAGLAGDIRDIFAEAKSAGFDTKVMRTVLKKRRLAKEERQEQEAIEDLYQAALGMK